MGMDLTPINRPSICFIPFIIISIASEGQATFPVTVKGGCSTAHITTISGQIQIKLADSKIEKATSLEKSYAQKLVTVRLGGVLKLLDPVLELNPLNDFGQSICAAELPPFLLG